MPDPNQILERARQDGKSPEFLKELQLKLGVDSDKAVLPENVKVKDKRDMLLSKLESDGVDDNFKFAVLRKFDKQNNLGPTTEKEAKQDESYKSLATQLSSQPALKLGDRELDSTEAPSQVEVSEEVEKGVTPYADELAEGHRADVKAKEEERQRRIDEGEVGALESVRNTTVNGLIQIASIPPKLDFAYGVLTGDEEKVAQANDLLKSLESNQKYTIGFTDLDKQEGFGKVLGFGAATYNAVTSFAISALEMQAAPGGVLLWADVYSSTLRDYNQILAEEKGISLEELIENGDYDATTPAAISGIVFALERIGYGKVTGSTKFLSKLPPSTLRSIGQILESGGAEGLTEWLQGGVEEYGKLDAKGGDTQDNIFEALKWLGSKEGRETLYQGAVGGKALAGPRVIKQTMQDRRSEADKKTIEENNKLISQLEDQKNNPNLSKEELEAINEAQESAQEKVNEAIINPYKDLINVSNEGISHITELNKGVTELHQKALEVQQSENMDAETKAAVIAQIDSKIKQLENQALSIIAMSNEAVNQKKETLLDKVRAKIKDKQKPKKNADGTTKQDTKSTFDKKQEEEAAVEKEEQKIQKEQENLEGDAINVVNNKYKETEAPAETVEKAVLEQQQFEEAETTSESATKQLVELGDKLQAGEITKDEYKQQAGSLRKQLQQSNKVLFDKYGNKKQRLFNEDGTINEGAYKLSSKIKKQFYQPVEEVGDKGTPEQAEKIARSIIGNVEKAIPGLKVKFFQKKRGENDSHFDPATGTIYIDKGATTNKGASKVLEDFFHESGHAWSEVVRKQHKELYQEIERVILNDKSFQKFYKDSRQEGHPYSHLTERELADEYFQRIVGVRGAAFVQANPNLTQVNKNKLLNKLKSFWLALAKKLGIKQRPSSVEDLAQIVVGKMITGEEINAQELTSKIREERILKQSEQTKEKASRQLRAQELLKTLKPQGKDKQEKNFRERGISYEEITNSPELELYEYSDRNVSSDHNKYIYKRDDVSENLYGVKNYKDLTADEKTIVDLETHAILQSRSQRDITPIIVLRMLQQRNNKKVLYIADTKNSGAVGIAVVEGDWVGANGQLYAATSIIDPILHDGLINQRIEFDTQAIRRSAKLAPKEADMVKESVEKAKEIEIKKSPKLKAKPMTQEEAAQMLQSTKEQQEAMFEEVSKLLDVKKADLAKKSGKAKVIADVENEKLIKAFAGAVRDIKGGEAVANIFINAGKNMVEQTIEEKKEQLKSNGVIGSVIFEELRKMGVLDLDVGWKKDDPITIVIKDQEAFNLFISAAGFKPTETKYGKPQFTEPNGYENFTHETGINLFSKSTPEGKKQPKKVYDVINRAIKTVQNVDTELLTILENVKNKLTPENPSQLRLFQEVMRIARTIGDKPYYSLYRYDFRGRIYSAMNYLNHQGSEMAKSLVRVGKPVPLGRGGWKWLLIQATDTMGVDEVLLEDRFNHADGKLKEWMEWASDPVAHFDKWNAAEEPYVFLSTILEIKRALESGNPLAYESNLAIQMDATTSGPQIMIAITKDANGAPIVNLTDSKERGDLYTEAGYKVQQWMETAPENKQEIFEQTDKELKRLQKAVSEAKSTEAWQQAQNEFWEFVKNPQTQKNIEVAAQVFFSNPKILAKFRKLMKGPTMTKYYSAGDKKIALALTKTFKEKEGFEGLEYSYALVLAKKITSELDNILEGPGKLMNQLVSIGNALAKKGLPIQYSLPVNGFNMVQNPKEQVKDKFRIPYAGDNKNIIGKNKDRILNLAFNYTEKDQMDKSKVASSTAPNIIHALDAQIPAWLYSNTDMDILTIHDSFGTVAGRAEEMYNEIRNGFVDIFDKNILEDFFDQTVGKNQEALGLSDKVLAKRKEKFLSLIGNFDISGVKKNEFAFSAGVGIVRSGKLTDKQKFEIVPPLMEKQQDENLKHETDKILEESKDCK